MTSLQRCPKCACMLASKSCSELQATFEATEHLCLRFVNFPTFAMDKRFISAPPLTLRCVPLQRNLQGLRRERGRPSQGSLGQACPTKKRRSMMRAQKLFFRSIAPGHEARLTACLARRDGRRRSLRHSTHCRACCRLRRCGGRRS